MTKVWTREGSRSIENLREDKEQGYFGGISNNKIHSRERNLYGKKKKRRMKKAREKLLKSSKISYSKHALHDSTILQNFGKNFLLKLTVSRC